MINEAVTDILILECLVQSGEAEFNVTIPSALMQELHVAPSDNSKQVSSD
jgi:hypothetical protein